MPIKSLIGELPHIVADGNREAAAILDRLSSPNRITVQTNEVVLPAKASANIRLGKQARRLRSQKNGLSMATTCWPCRRCWRATRRPDFRRCAAKWTLSISTHLSTARSTTAPSSPSLVVTSTRNPPPSSSLPTPTLGRLATYHPDFLVATADKMYMIETKRQDKVKDRNVLQKRRAAVEWCEKTQRPACRQARWPRMGVCFDRRELLLWPVHEWCDLRGHLSPLPYQCSRSAGRIKVRLDVEKNLIL